VANKLFTLQDGRSAVESENLEVYVDIAADSAPDFNAPPPRKAVGEFIRSSERFLSAFRLSSWTYDDNVRVAVDLSVTGWDWMMRPEYTGAYRRLAEDGRLTEAFARGGAGDTAGLVFSYLSVDDDYDFTQQTLNKLSSAVSAASSAFASDMEAEAYQWRYKVSDLVNVNAVKNSIRQIFTWIPGERIINPEFGSNLKKYLYEPITEENQEKIVVEIQQCVLRWEPRVVIDRVVNATAADDVEENTVKLDIYYRIKGLDDRQFMYQYEFSRTKYSYL